jgi:hypothetical protein
VVAVPVVIAVVVGAVLLASGGGTPNPKPTNAKLLQARRTYCHDLSILQNGFRPEALGRFLTKMKRDEALFRAAGDHPSVKDLTAIRRAGRLLKTAVEQNTGVGPAGAELQRVIGIGPPC